MMKTPTHILFCLATLMGGTLTAAGQCSCEAPCACTKEKHCGCMPMEESMHVDATAEVEEQLQS